jgi:hypothetical protein
MSDYPWMIFTILVVGGFFGTLAVIPYSLDLNPTALEKIKAKQALKAKPLPAMLVVVLAAVVQGTILSALSAFLGLLAARALGLDLPILRSILAGQPVLERVQVFLPVTLLGGIAVGGVLLALERYFYYPRLPANLKETAKRLSFWKSFLACFYGGFVEEILLRLFVMSGLAWLLTLVWHAPSGVPSPGLFWTANILAALLFAAGHLPATVRITRLTPLIISRAFILNVPVGLLCGYLFMTYGLEAAMLAHFTVDVIIHLVALAFLPAAGEIQSQSVHA